MTVGDLVLLEWDDAAFDLDEPPERAIMRTVGWVTHVGTNHVTLASEACDEDGTQRAFTRVPRAMILHVDQLTPERETFARPAA